MSTYWDLYESTPAIPNQGFGRLYVKSDKSIHFIDDNGTDTNLLLGGAGGGGQLGIMGWDTGIPIGTGTILDVGNNLSLSISGTVLRLDADSQGGVGIQGIPVWDEGIPIGTGTILNFVGGGIDTSRSGTVVRVHVTGTVNFDDTYYRRDTTNNPITGNVRVSGTMSVNLADEGSSGIAAIFQSFHPQKTPIWAFQYSYSGTNSGAPVARFVRDVLGSLPYPIKWTIPLIRIESNNENQDYGVGISYLGVGNAERIRLNPNATGTANPAHFLDTVYGLPTGSKTFEVRHSGTSQFHVGINGLFGGNELLINEGSNAAMGIATLVAGTITVNTNKVTSSCRIFLTHQNTSGTLGILYVSARVVGTSFTITSTNVADTSQIAWIIVEPR